MLGAQMPLATNKEKSMPWKQEAPEWVPEAYPKMLTQKNDDGTLKPVLYPAGHEKQGLPVIFSRDHTDCKN